MRLLSVGALWKTSLFVFGIAVPCGTPAFAGQHGGAGPNYCYQEPGRRAVGGGTVRVNGFTIEVKPDPNLQEMLCHATIRSPRGVVVFQYDDWGIDIDPVTGKDVNGDGQPDAVLVGFSGGAHCCWTYSIISLSHQPGLIRVFENRQPASFEDSKGDGRVEILVRDGGFDEFDRLAHPFSPFPLLVLRLEGDKFKDVGSEFLDIYDKEIHELRSKLSAPRLEQFLHSNPAESHDALDYNETESDVLLIVLDFLYSGRPKEAWDALDELWPANDRQRVRHEMAGEYCTGLRTQLGVALGQACKGVE
jgi:hypothetical protein